MDTLQGRAIPVYLGNVDLTSPFHRTARATIVHLMLLSWAGEEAWQCKIESKRLQLESIRTYNEVAVLGVQQGDMSPLNVLWNFELDRAVLIDFEYARINKADEVINAAIARQERANKRIKSLGKIKRNQAADGKSVSGLPCSMGENSAYLQSQRKQPFSSTPQLETRAGFETGILAKMKVQYKMNVEKRNFGLFGQVFVARSLQLISVLLGSTLLGVTQTLGLFFLVFLRKTVNW